MRMTLEVMTTWHKKQRDLVQGDYGLIVTSSDEERGLLPGWVRILERLGDRVRVQVVAPGPSVGRTWTNEDVIHIERVMPISQNEYAACLMLLENWLEPWFVPPLRIGVELRLGAFFDRRRDGYYYATEYSLNPVTVDVLSVIPQK